VATVESPVSYLEEILDFFASEPTRDQMLKYRPSQQVQVRARELLAKQNRGGITQDEQEELDQFVQAELIMELLAARIHAREAKQP
jgi:energy-converting hydrogenase Eha subunit F